MLRRRKPRKSSSSKKENKTDDKNILSKRFEKLNSLWRRNIVEIQASRQKGTSPSDSEALFSPCEKVSQKSGYHTQKVISPSEISSTSFVPSLVMGHMNSCGGNTEKNLKHHWSSSSEMSILHHSFSSADLDFISSSNLLSEKVSCTRNILRRTINDDSLDVISTSSLLGSRSKFCTATDECGRDHYSNLKKQLKDYDSNKVKDSWLGLNDDPTVEESIECVFAHQLEDGLPWVSIKEEFVDLKSSDCPIKSDGYMREISREKKDNLKSNHSIVFCGAFSNADKINSSYSKICDEEPYQSWINNSSENEKDMNNGNFSITKISKKRYQKSGRLIHLGNYVPLEQSHLSKTLPKNTVFSVNQKRIGKATVHSYDKNLFGKVCNLCALGKNTFPLLPIEKWPQSPLFLRPTPGSNTKIRGIRFIGSKDYLWPESELYENHYGEYWWNILHKIWHSESKEDSEESVEICPECCCLPVNNGNEKCGQSLVVDFESELFIGTLLIRIRHSNGSTSSPYDDEFGYFSDMNRQYQAVVRGHFKKKGIPMIECVTGQVFENPFVKLPPRLICRGAVKVMTFFAPRLQAKIDGSKPNILSPLGSTPQTIHVDNSMHNFKSNNETYKADETLEIKMEEPLDVSKKLMTLPSAINASHSMARAKARKNAFDALCSTKEKSLTFDTNVVYTFEFLQHLIDFTTFQVNLGRLGKLRLKDILDGQPLRFMAAHQRQVHENDVAAVTFSINDTVLEAFWSFDLWHRDSVKNTKAKM